ncbi:MAG: chemotaxis-specific protein-glutamate methyltransferase CheB [Promethearchaeota archaeon]
MVSENITIVIADDSTFIRKKIERLINVDSSIQVVGFAKDGQEAIKKVKDLQPDVLLLDLVMPKMDGLKALEIVMQENPLPVIILSAINPAEMDSSFQALLLGAFDFLVKPSNFQPETLKSFQRILLSKINLAFNSRIKLLFKPFKVKSYEKAYFRQRNIDEVFQFGLYLNKLETIEDKSSLNNSSHTSFKKTLIIDGDRLDYENLNEELELKSKVMRPKTKVLKKIKKKKNNFYYKVDTTNELTKKPTTEKKTIIIREHYPIPQIIVIGASIGGPRTIKLIISQLPTEFNCPILIVQHISGSFIETYAKNLKEICNFHVKVAEDGAIIQPKTIYFAPGDFHMQIDAEQVKPLIKIFKGEPINGCMPSIDVLFKSAAERYKSHVLAILLTGMGNDGIDGLKVIRHNNGIIISESEETCILYGMPRIAAENHLSDFILPSYEIPQKILELIKYN